MKTSLGSLHLTFKEFTYMQSNFGLSHASLTIYIYIYITNLQFATCNQISCTVVPKAHVLV